MRAVAKSGEASAHIETWEEIALRLADQAGIATPSHELIEVAGKAVMLSRRFDRDGAARIPFLSAMAMMSVTPDCNKMLWLQGFYQRLQDGFASQSLLARMTPVCHWLAGAMRMKGKNVPKENGLLDRAQHLPNHGCRALSYPRPDHRRFRRPVG